MNIRILAVAAALSLGLMTAGAHAAPKSQAAAPAAVASATETDTAFVTKATYANNLFIELANLITRQGVSGSLREFAVALAREHIALKSELKTIAEAGHFMQPSGIDEACVQPRDHIAKLSGAAFDKAMWQMLCKLHCATVSLFEGEIAHGADKKLVLWAKQRLPLIEKHRAIIEKQMGNCCKGAKCSR